MIGPFEQMVAARLIEPTSKASTPGALLSEIGWPGTAQHNTLQACLVRARERGYRESLSRVLFDHVTTHQGPGTVPAGVTTLYFEGEGEDELRWLGYWQGEEDCSPDHRGLAG